MWGTEANPDGAEPAEEGEGVEGDEDGDEEDVPGRLPPRLRLPSPAQLHSSLPSHPWANLESGVVPAHVAEEEAESDEDGDDGGDGEALERVLEPVGGALEPRQGGVVMLRLASPRFLAAAVAYLWITASVNPSNERNETDTAG